MFKNFAIKMSKSERFSRKWLPKVDDDERRALRGMKEYIEFQARTERLFKSPIYHMRRVLNNL